MQIHTVCRGRNAEVTGIPPDFPEGRRRVTSWTSHSSERIFTLRRYQQPYTCLMSRSRLFPGIARCPVSAVLPFAVLVCLTAQPPAVLAWGNEGHRMINRLAAGSLP